MLKIFGLLLYGEDTWFVTIWWRYLVSYCMVKIFGLLLYGEDIWLVIVW